MRFLAFVFQSNIGWPGRNLEWRVNRIVRCPNDVFGASRRLGMRRLSGRCRWGLARTQDHQSAEQRGGGSDESVNGLHGFLPWLLRDLAASYAATSGRTSESGRNSPKTMRAGWDTSNDRGATSNGAWRGSSLSHQPQA